MTRFSTWPVRPGRSTTSTTGQDGQTNVLGTLNLWGGEKGQGRFCWLLQRGLRSPKVHPQPGRLLGAVNPSASAMLRRGKRMAETLMMDTTAATGSDPHRAHLQHLRAPHGLRRRGVSPTSCCRPAQPAITVTVRAASPAPSARQRHGGRALAMWRRGLHRAGQPGQPREFTILELASWSSSSRGARARSSTCPAADDPVQRRPDIARRFPPGLAALGAARRGAQDHHRRFRGPARRRRGIGLPRRYPELPVVGVAGVVVAGDRLLLVRRGRPPAQGIWSLPGGVVELGEPLRAACAG